MKQNIPIQQEILLMTNTSVSRKAFCEREDKGNARHASPVEELEQACWNGMLEDMVPEVLQTTSEGKALLLWQIQHGKNFLHIDLCEEPLMGNHEDSIDPYIFLHFVQYN